MSTVTVPVDPQNEWWHAQRKLGVGGSEAHHLFPALNLEDPADPGSRYGCPRKLGYEKLGITPDYEYTPAQQRLFDRGHLLEDIAAQKYMAKTGRKVWRQNNPFVSKTHPFMRCNIDRRIKADERGLGVLECKSANEHAFVAMEQEGLPIGYSLQINHSLAVVGAEWGSFAVVVAPDYLDAVLEQIEDGRLRKRIIDEVAPSLDFVHFDVPRDENLIGVIVEKESQFWSLVEAKKLPDPLPDMKDDRCKSCNYRKTCRGAQFAEANSKIVRDKSGVQYVQIEDPKFAELCADRITAMKQIDELSETMKAIDNEIKQWWPKEVGAIALKETPVRIRWGFQRGATRWDSDALKADSGTIGRKVAFADWVAQQLPGTIKEFSEEFRGQEFSLADKYTSQGSPSRPFVFTVK